MGSKRDSQFENNTDGFGMIEVLMALAMLAMVTISLTIFSKIQRTQITNLSSSTSCTSVTNGITNTIRAFDNTLMVRNWLTSANTPRANASNPTDPYCKITNGRTPVCDTIPMYTTTNGYVVPGSYQNYLNVRGAFSWAQSVYNTYRGNGICDNTLANRATPGMRISTAQLRALLPADMELPNWVDHYHLFIKDKGLACGEISTSANATFEIGVMARYKTQTTNLLSYEACRAVVEITTPRDMVKPTLALTSVMSGTGSPNGSTVVPMNRCTDLRPFVAIGGNVGTEWQTVTYTTRVSEPGVLALCTKSGTGENDAGQFQNCADLTLRDGAHSIITPGDSQISYNQTPDVLVRLTAMRDRGGIDGDIHTYGVKVVDIGGNESQTLSSSFFVHSPRCRVPPTDYCPGAPPNPGPILGPNDPLVLPVQCRDPNTGLDVPCAVNPWELPTGCGGPGCIGSRPYDDCLNGLCPDGQRRVCTPATAAVTCFNQTFLDDCGNDSGCMGAWRPACPTPAEKQNVQCNQPVRSACGEDCGLGTGPNCALAQPAGAVDCGEERRDPCGNLCGYGTRNCPAGPAGPVGAECTCTGMGACGTYWSDVCIDSLNCPSGCGNPGVCGPGICPPTPAPRAPLHLVFPNAFQCSRHGHARTKEDNTQIPIPAGWASYRATITMKGHRHGGSGMAWTHTLVGNTVAVWAKAGRGSQLGAELGGIHPFNPLPHFGTIQLDVQGGSVNFLHIHCYVNDAESNVDVTIDGTPYP